MMYRVKQPMWKRSKGMLTDALDLVRYFQLKDD